LQGYILKIQKVREEDSIVFLLTERELLKCYRFYGARHSIVTQGFKIDFELFERGVFLPVLQNISHLGFSWLASRERLFVWQQFLRLLFEHIKDSEAVGEFYFSLVEKTAAKFARQNPKRAVVEAFLELLHFEGRLEFCERCFFCDGVLSGEKSVALLRAFLTAHSSCAGKFALDVKDVRQMFKTCEVLHASDSFVSEVFDVVMEGF